MKNCVVCNLEHDKYGATCSKYCKSALISKKLKGKTGGYREGSGRAKTGYYKEIYCGSTYELVWVIYQLDHKLNFERFQGCVKFGTKKYFPDFLQNGKIIEIKGYEKQSDVEAKTEIANKNGYDVIVLRRDNLALEFAYVEANYSYKNLYELYDNFVPSFEYVCPVCMKVFHRDKLSKTQNPFCSRFCGGKGSKKKRKLALAGGV